MKINVDLVLYILIEYSHIRIHFLHSLLYFILVINAILSLYRPTY